MSQNNALQYKNLCFCLLDSSQRLITQVNSFIENYSTFNHLQRMSTHTHKNVFLVQDMPSMVQFSLSGMQNVNSLLDVS